MRKFWSSVFELRNNPIKIPNKNSFLPRWVLAGGTVLNKFKSTLQDKFCLVLKYEKILVVGIWVKKESPDKKFQNKNYFLPRDIAIEFKWKPLRFFLFALILTSSCSFTRFFTIFSLGLISRFFTALISRFFSDFSLR